MSHVYEPVDRLLVGVNVFLESYFTESRSSLIVSLVSVFIGIYATVWCVIATSISNLNRKILELNLDTVIFDSIVFRVIVSLLCIGIIIYVPNSVRFYYFFVGLFNALSLISFGRFLYLIQKLTQASIKSIIEEIDFNDEMIRKYKSKMEDIWNDSNNRRNK